LGGKGDQSYNDAVAASVPKLKARGYAVREFEPASLEDYRRGLEALASASPKIIFCVGFLYEEPLKTVAVKHSAIEFVVLDGQYAAPPNVGSIKFLAGEGARLAGNVAAQASQSKRIAFIGGMDIPVINEFRDGFGTGVRDRDSTIKVDSYYIGAGATAFTDPVRGREVALTAISRGADVLFHAAGTSGNGVIQAAKEKHVLAIGVDVDQSHLAPGTVLTSMLKRLDVAVLRAVADYEGGARLGGRVIALGLKDSAVGLAPIDTVALKSAQAPRGR
jgi:basic membrane protein A